MNKRQGDKEGRLGSLKCTMGDNQLFHTAAVVPDGKLVGLHSLAPETKAKERLLLVYSIKVHTISCTMAPEEERDRGEPGLSCIRIELPTRRSIALTHSRAKAYVAHLGWAPERWWPCEREHACMMRPRRGDERMEALSDLRLMHMMRLANHTKSYINFARNLQPTKKQHCTDVVAISRLRLTFVGARHLIYFPPCFQSHRTIWYATHPSKACGSL